MSDRSSDQLSEDTQISEREISSPPSDKKFYRGEIPRGEPVFGKYRWWIIVVPFIVYLLGVQGGAYIEKLRERTIEGTIGTHPEHGNRKIVDRSDAYEEAKKSNQKILGYFYINRHTYPYTYVPTILATGAFVLCFGWGYFKVPVRISFWSVVVGAVGVVLWVVIAGFDRTIAEMINEHVFSNKRPAFNPFEEFESKSALWQFLAVRFLGLVVLVPLTEEFFIRGFLMRYVDDPDWDEVPMGIGKIGGWISPAIYGVATHLTEPLSAFVWFSMVTWLYYKTGSVWDCVVAHAVTNLLLGIYVVNYEQWHLW